MRTNEQEVVCMKEILSSYEKASDQVLNLNKSELMFSSNVLPQTRVNISKVLGVQERPGVDKYLGLPTLIGRNKRDVFHYIKDRIWRKISSWKGKTLSIAGKEILIKSVAQAIPSYCMSMYLIPLSLADEIQKMLNSFL